MNEREREGRAKKEPYADKAEIFEYLSICERISMRLRPFDAVYFAPCHIDVPHKNTIKYDM